ncbi:hypothetical protein [Nonomuraea sp. LPB2021202275-12-8]|uniref:hypothetical protein n=1 Tax=Nonomuraea sp. LPB2021202275-12-8 TaxID=3120159 RepID=UPI00300CA0CE
MSTTGFDTTIDQAHDLLRWRSPLRTELWAARLTAVVRSGQDEPLLRRLAEDGRPEARLALAALAAVNAPPPPEAGTSGRAEEPEGAEATAHPDDDADPIEPYLESGRQAAGSLPGWVARMGRVTCEGAWYGKADRYGEQTLAALSFRYGNGKEPHLLVVGIDQVHGGLAVDAVIEEIKFLDDLDLAPSGAEVVAGRVLDAFELTDLVMGAQVAETLPAVRALALSRARAVPDPVRHAGDDIVTRFQDLPDVPGAQEAFGKLAEFLGDRPLWWSPPRVAQFLTSWLPREAVLSDEAIAAMPEVARSWTRHHGDHPDILHRIDTEAPRLPALMADESLAGLSKRIIHHRP